MIFNFITVTLKHANDFLHSVMYMATVSKIAKYSIKKSKKGIKLEIRHYVPRSS